MSERDAAAESIGRLEAWIRDFGHEKQPAFIADLQAVIDGYKRLRGDRAELAKQKLRQLMSDVSEEEWFASWLDELEFVLWCAVQDDDFASFRRSHIDELRRLSGLCGGWWTYEEFVPLAEWERRFAEWKGK